MSTRLRLALAASLVAVPAASGAQVIGPDLTATTTYNICSGGVACTYMNGTPDRLADVVGADGVITKWRLQSGSGGGPVTLRVLRRESAGLRAVASSDQQTTVAGVAEYAARIPVLAGDAVGVDNSNSALIFGASARSSSVFDPAVAAGALAPAPRPAPLGVGRELLVNATIEPDTDRDGFGDETQDACPGDSARQATPCTPALDLGPLVATAAVTRRQALRPFVVRTALTRPASVQLTLVALRPGRRAGGLCLPVDVARTGPRCTARVVVRDRTRDLPAGSQRLVLSLVGLPSGRYQIRAIATDRGGSNAVDTSTRLLTIRAR